MKNYFASLLFDNITTLKIHVKWKSFLCSISYFFTLFNFERNAIYIYGVV